MPEIPRESGLGSTDIAALVGMSPYRDSWAVYASKIGLLDGVQQNVDPRKKWGALLQKVIAQAFTEETGLEHEWIDKPVRNSERAWQFSSPDAVLINLPHVLEVKTAGLDQARHWGESGTEEIPDHYAIQAHWHMSALGMEACDVAVLIAGNDFRRYVIHRDPEIEARLLEVAERFWRTNVLARVPPPIGCSQAAADYLKQRFPRNIQNLRSATAAELELLAKLKQAKEEFQECEIEKDSLENAVKQAIGDADGLTLPGKGKVTWTKNKDAMGINWQAVAQDIWELLTPAERTRTFTQMTSVEKYQIVTRHGPRVLRCAWPRDDSWTENAAAGSGLEKGAMQ